MPLVDHRVIEFSWRLPESLKVRQKMSKWLLRQVLYRRVPRQLVERPKFGFTVPISAWLRCALRDWASDLLDPERLKSDGIVQHEQVSKGWRDFLAGKRVLALGLSVVVMFQAWKERGCTNALAAGCLRAPFMGEQESVPGLGVRPPVLSKRDQRFPVEEQERKPGGDYRAQRPPTQRREGSSQRYRSQLTTPPV